MTRLIPRLLLHTYATHCIRLRGPDIWRLINNENQARCSPYQPATRVGAQQNKSESCIMLRAYVSHYTLPHRSRTYSIIRAVSWVTERRQL